MRKAKVAAVTIGLLASVLGGKYVITDAAAVRLDDSAANTPETSKPTSAEKNEKTAATKTSIKTTPTGTKNNAIRQHNRKLATAPVQEISAEEFQKIPEIQEVPETSPVENAENTEEIAENPAIEEELVSEVIEEIEIESESEEVTEEMTENLEIAKPAQAEETTRIFVKSVPTFKHKAQPVKRKDSRPAETSTELITDPTEEPTESTETSEPIIITKPAETSEDPETNRK
ncbi:MAG: hypothetical protein K2G25_09105 [Oscillospiraceae bacterium]|nr:hypothetical protein [Oscillospiraceae bacterium]